ncbi:MAG: TetR/AcrR family transcriptional regulator, partial [Pseudomonadota bacterium]
RDTAVADAVADEDTARVAAIATFYERMDFAPTDAFIRARVIYFTQVSYYALGVSEPLARRASFLSAYFRTFTGREIDAGAAARFLTRMGEEA